MFRETIAGGDAARTLPPLHSTLDEQLPMRLRDLARRLRLIVPVLSVSILALKQQDAELDHDIAVVLHRHASDPLDLEIEQLEEVLQLLVARHTQGAAA